MPCVNSARAQPALTSGVTSTGDISPVGDSDTWTFSANAGEPIIIRVGEMTQVNNFQPRLRLFNPVGGLQASALGSVAAEIAVTATNTGTFTVIVDDAVGTTATGTYRLTLANPPHAVSTSPVMTNGVMHTGTIDVGDLDLWTFNANTGDSIVVRMGETNSGSSLTPQLRLFGPNGALLDSFGGTSAAAAEVAVRATNSGTFIVLVGDLSAGWAGSGGYRLTLAKTGDPVVTSSGDEGGPLVNGAMRNGTISIGDLDVWTLSANAGDSFIVRMGETVPGPLTPHLRLFGPNGALLSEVGNSTVAAEVSFRATNSGTFLVIADDLSAQYAGSGTYRLTLAKTGDPIVVSGGDEGGPIINGFNYPGTLDLGDLDLWSFNANAGDNIVVRMGETTPGSSLTPQLRLFGPNGALLDSFANSTVAAEVAIRATNSGTFLIVASDLSAQWSGTGAYRLCLVKTGGGLAIYPGDEGGPLTNGVMHTGTIDVGDLDPWTFNATAGDNIVVRMGELVQGSTLTPHIRLFGPNGALLDEGTSGGFATEVAVRATNNGIFLVLVDDLSTAYSGSGGYRLTLAKTGDSVLISSGDEGGPMTNAIMHTGSISLGDLDLWTFSATAGDYLIIGMGDMGSALTPHLRLFSPNGVLLQEFANYAASEVAFRATNSGTFLVVADDLSSGYAGTGPYRLTLAKTGDPVLISSGDEGGPLTNGWTHTGTIDVGDLDAWTFNATAGDNIVVRMGETTNGSPLTPYLRFLSPNGVLLSDFAGTAASEVAFRATNNGTFLIVAGDLSSGYAGSGSYRLNLASTRGPVVISSGDEGGPLTNGWTHSGVVDVGDLDVWTFNANAGENIVARMGQIISSNNLTPHLRLFGPNGALLSEFAGSVASEVSVRATNNGRFILLADDLSAAYAGSGAYRLTLAKTGDPVLVSSGDEGGLLTGSGSYSGTIGSGDLDVWTFTACDGDLIELRMEELSGAPFTPWIRLYSRDGTLLDNVANSVNAFVSRRAPLNGRYMVILGDFSAAYGGSGTYQFTVNGLTDSLKLCVPSVSGANLNLTGVGGTPQAGYTLFTTTNIITPGLQWDPIRTNQFDDFGLFTYTNLFDPADLQHYFRLRSP